MASIRDFTVTEFTATTTPWEPDEMPVHASGDLLIAFMGKDNSAAGNFTQSTGWTEYIDQTTAGAVVGCQCLRAASSSEVFSSTPGAAETGVLVIIAVKDVYGTTLADALNLAPVVASADDSAIPYDGVTGQSTTVNDCLIITAFGADGGVSPTAYAPLVTIYGGDATNGSLGVAYTFQKTSGAIPNYQWFGRGNDDGRAMLMAVRTSGTGARAPYSDPAISSGQVLRPLVGLSTMQSDSWPTAVTITALGEDFEANSVYVYESAPTWADDTTDANDPGTADVTWSMHNTGDAMYFGDSEKFGSLSFITSTAGVTGVVAWEYWNGSTWATATGMTGSFTATGGAKVAFTRENPPANWATNDPGMGQTKYWVRARITTSYTVAVVQSQIRMRGWVASYVVATASADAGTNPYTDATQDAGSTTVNCAGCQINFGAALDMDTGIIYTTLVPVLPRDIAIDIALPTKNAGGVQVSLFDTNNNCLSYKIAAKGCKDISADSRNVIGIDWNGAATSWAICGTINKSAVTYVHLTSLGYYGAAAVRWSMLSVASQIGIAGGSTGTPLNLNNIVYVANRCIGMFPFMEQSGAAAMVNIPLQFGGGDPVFINCNLNSFQFPTIYDGVEYFRWNAAANVAGVKFYPKTGDVLKFTNSVFTSGSAYRWEFDASSASSGWTGDFTGTTVVNATVTLRDVMTFDSMVFINCPTFTQNAATITNGEFTGTKVSCSSPANAAKISDTSFTSAGTGHAIEIGGTAANFNFDGNTFSGYAVSDGSTGNEAIYVNIASGTMTINITGGGSVPSIRTAGATVVVQNMVTLTVTVKNEAGGNIENARVSIQTSNTYSLKGAVADDGGSQTNQTAAANNATANDMTLLPATPAVNDAYYFGAAEPFHQLVLNVGQNGAGTWTVVWEYWDGVDWNNTIPDVVDGSDGFRAGTGNRDVKFSPPTDWAETTVQSISAFWIRARVSSYTSVTTQPLGTQAWVYLQIMNELTNASGVATESFNYTADTDINIKVRKSTTGTTKYYPVNTAGTIIASGFSLTQILIQDSIAAA